MKLKRVAAISQELYNSGRTISGDEKLDDKDFLQLVFLKYGGIAQIEFYNQRKAGNDTSHFYESIKTSEFDVVKPDNMSRASYIVIGEYLNLPYMAGILSIYPCSEGHRDHVGGYDRIKPGGEKIYGKPKMLDDLGMKFFVPKADRIELWGGDEQDEKVSVDYLPMSEDTDIPLTIARVIVSELFKDIFPGRDMPVDFTEDNDPNTALSRQRTYNVNQQNSL